MQHACQNAHQVNILTARTCAKPVLINVFYAKQHHNVLFAERLSLVLGIKSCTTTSTSSVRNNALIVTIKILKTWMTYFVEVVPQVAISVLTKILVQFVIMDGIWTHSNKKIMQTEMLKFRIFVWISASQDFSLLMTQTTGSVSLVWANVSAVIIPHIVQNVPRDMSCLLTLELFQQLILVLINVLMVIMLMQRMSAKNASIIARHAITTILAKFATLVLSK